MEYGMPLNGYSLVVDSSGRKLYRIVGHKEYPVGYVEKEEEEKHGPVSIKIWTLKSGVKYHYTSVF